MKDLAVLAFRNLRNSEKRTYLTIIGIFIGIAAVVALVSVGQGLQNSIDDQFAKIGADKLFVQNTANLFGTGGEDLTNQLTIDDLEAVRRVRGVHEATGLTYRSAKVEVGEDVGFYFVASMPLDEHYELVREFSTVEIKEGRELRSGDRNSVLVGHDYTRSEVFLEPAVVGDRITVNGAKFRIVGVIEPLGNAIDDRTIWMPAERFDDLFNTSEIQDMILVRTAPNENPSEVGERVNRALLQERNLDEEDKDFSVTTPEELLESFNVILLIVRVVLVGIAAISLLVGGVGIMNTMYTAVLERTKEIGIMKAIGATPKTIQTIFLMEAGLLGLVGGVLGVIVGLIIAFAVEWIGRLALGGADFLHAYIGWELVVGALLFSTIVGMISGYFPARQAARHNVVDSLRYE